MPLTKSAKKALRQTKRRRARNLIKLEAIRKIRREILKLVAAGKVKDAQAKMPLLYKVLDKAAKARVIRPNAVARKKSRLAKLVQKAVKK